MDKSCVDCKYLLNKETKRSKLPYGYCKKLKLNMTAVQMDCEYYKQQEIEKGTA